LEAISAIANLVTIVQGLASIFRKLKKREEADAMDKAVKTIQSQGDISADEAKQTLAHTLTDELGEEKARPIIQYTDMVETLFPFRPTGALLQYGTAIEELVLQIHAVLMKLQAFGLFGERLESNSRLQFLLSGQAFYGVGGHIELLPNHATVYGLTAYLYQRPHMLLGGPKAKFRESIHDYFVLEAKPLDDIIPIFLQTDANLPFSLIFSNFEGKTIEKRLESYQFAFCMKSLLDDTKICVERVAREFQESIKESQDFSRSMNALRQLTESSPLR
jgi:hypothetical protein